MDSGQRALRPDILSRATSLNFSSQHRTVSGLVQPCTLTIQCCEANGTPLQATWTGGPGRYKAVLRQPSSDVSPKPRNSQICALVGRRATAVGHSRARGGRDFGGAATVEPGQHRSLRGGELQEGQQEGEEGAPHVSKLAVWVCDLNSVDAFLFALRALLYCLQKCAMYMQAVADAQADSWIHHCFRAALWCSSSAPGQPDTKCRKRRRRSTRTRTSPSRRRRKRRRRTKRKKRKAVRKSRPSESVRRRLSHRNGNRIHVPSMRRGMHDASTSMLMSHAAHASRCIRLLRATSNDQ
jgi:hypothetical protein